MYKKRWMTIAELIKEGIPKRILYEICHTPGQRLAFQFEKNGKWHIDTNRLDEELKRRAL